MVENQDIVVIGIQPWNIEIGSNCKNIAAEMAKKNRVLYVNQPLSRIVTMKPNSDPFNNDRLDVLKGKKNTLTQLSENLWELNPRMVVEPINKFPLKLIFDFITKKDAAKFASEINKAIDKLGFKDYILFNDSYMFLGRYLDKYLNYKYSIYYIRDNLINSPNPYWNTHGKRVEEIIIRKSDVVVTNSVYYTEYAKAFNAQSYMVGQGCDATLFDFKARDIIVPDDLKKIPSPVIGYVGFLTKKRLDLKLISFLATSRPDWQIVLVGPEDETFQASDLHSFKNIHFLGPKPPELLPEYIKGFDVCINPQVLNKTTIGNYPRKIDEYLAMGKPVVATKTKAMEYFEEFTYLCETNADYLQMIRKALNEDNPDIASRRREFALNHSWENNVAEIWKALNSFIEFKKSKTPTKNKVMLENRPKLKKFLHYLMVHPYATRPRLWVRVLVYPLIIKRGKGSIIKRKARLDIYPPKVFKIGYRTVIEDYTIINNGMGNIIIGDRCAITSRVKLVGPVTLGNMVTIGSGAQITGLTHNFEDVNCPIKDQGVSPNPTIVSDDVWIGGNSVIIQGLKIGTHCIIASGSVVTRDVPDYSVVAGNPAKVIKVYNFETKQWEKPTKS